MAVILTFAEHRDGALRRSALEAVGEAKRLGDALSATVESVLIGPGVRGLADELAAHGAGRVHAFDQPELQAYATEPYARAVAQVIAAVKPTAVLVPFTAMGRDLAPRVAAQVKAEFPRLDVLMNNAGVGAATNLKTPAADLAGRRLLEIHVREAEAVEEDDGRVRIRDPRLAIDLTTERL